MSIILITGSCNSKCFLFLVYAALSDNANVCRKQRDSQTRQENALGGVAHLHKDMLVQT